MSSGYTQQTQYDSCNIMTRKKWTNNDQEIWLKKQSNAFQLAEANNTRKDFFQETYKAWREQWPNPEPSQAVIDKVESKEMAIKQIYVAQENV
jgi:hypothetical protein